MNTNNNIQTQYLYLLNLQMLSWAIEAGSLAELNRRIKSIRCANGFKHAEA